MNKHRLKDDQTENVVSNKEYQYQYLAVNNIGFQLRVGGDKSGDAHRAEIFWNSF